MSKKQERVSTLLEMLHARGRLSVEQVSSALHLSESTVRRLFSQLEHENKVIRTHGGVQLCTPGVFNYSYNQSERRRSEQKERIGSCAAGYVRDSGCIFLDSGTTVLKLAVRLALDLEAGRVQNIIVLTNSLDIADILGGVCKVLMIGGEVRIERRDVCGAVSEKNLSLFRVERAFFGTDGIDLKYGLMTSDIQTANMYEILLRKASKVYVLADSEKFDKPSFVTYAAFTSVSGIITDHELAPDVQERYAKQGAHIILAD
jgi:DeoR/GlpR family transcriptional regulator of sugar metabolism